MTPSSALRIVHVAEDVSAVSGGVLTAVRQLSQRLIENGHAVQVVHACGDKGELPSAAQVFSYPPAGVGRIWYWGKGLRKGVAGLAHPANDEAVFHVHGIWSAPQYFAAREAYASGTPFVVTAHGMLDPWLWAQQGWAKYAKKRIYWELFAYPALSKAAVVHAITPLERRHLQALFPRNRIEVIPNAIDMESYVKDDEEAVERERLILFLGRINPKKGVDILLRAFAMARIQKDWKVAVVGPVWSDAYQAELEKIVSENNLQERVKFLPPVFGEEKYRLLRKAWVAAVPSHSEAVGLVNLEAGACCLPTITTFQTGLEDWEEGGGILIQPSIDEMRIALERACSWSQDEREGRGHASRVLVEAKYSWSAVLPQWLSLYQSVRI